MTRVIYMNQMDELRSRIEKIDSEMIDLFEQRMQISAKVAAYKKENGIPVLDKEREKILIEKNTAKLKNREFDVYYRDFFEGMLNVSKSYQHKLMEGVKVAYSGIEGSFASISAERILPDAKRISYGSFGEAYDAVCAGECDFAVLPIENSYAGEVGAVTDLMFKGNLHVNGVYELGVSQCLLGIKDSTLESIKTVVSHPQALDQCSEYIKRHGIKSISAENTAVAAKEIAEKNDMFFIGRLFDASLAAEASLKLKEISYIHSEAYAAGELKHGTISLIEPGTPVIALSSEAGIREKMVGNMKEVVARGANLFVFAAGKDGTTELREMAKTAFLCPDCPESVAPIALATAMQLLAYQVSLARGCDVDQPRNLAKSVTVE